MCFFFFFFKQKTAYEIGWCDWSSDVCSSDLPGTGSTEGTSKPAAVVPRRSSPLWLRSEERRVGKGVPASVDLGGRRIIKKKNSRRHSHQSGPHEHGCIAGDALRYYGSCFREFGVEFFFFKQKTAYEIGWCDWSSDVCSSDLSCRGCQSVAARGDRAAAAIA